MTFTREGSAPRLGVMSEKRREEEAYALAAQQAAAAEEDSATDDTSVDADETLEESEEPS